MTIKHVWDMIEKHEYTKLGFFGRLKMKIEKYFRLLGLKIYGMFDRHEDVADEEDEIRWGGT